MDPQDPGPEDKTEIHEESEERNFNKEWREDICTFSLHLDSLHGRDGLRLATPEVSNHRGSHREVHKWCVVLMQ